MSRVVITTEVGAEVVEHPDLEAAARHWDRSTFNVPNVTGGISVREYDGSGNCTRDGWLIHCHGGITYVNPSSLALR